MDKLIFLVDLCFGDDRDEILAFIIRRGDEEAAQAVVNAVKETWWENDDPNITYDDAIEQGFKEAGIWFDRTEYYVAWVNYYE